MQLEKYCYITYKLINQSITTASHQAIPFKGKNKVVPVPKCHAVKAYRGCILNLNTRWRRVVSFTLHPLYTQRKEPPTETGIEP